MPEGPVTVVVRLAPPRTSRVPSPPSAKGAPVAIHPDFLTAFLIALVTSNAVNDPRNLSGAARTRTFMNRKSLYQIPKIRLRLQLKLYQCFLRVQIIH